DGNNRPLLDLLERLRKAATTVLFAPADRDGRAKALWRVGDPAGPVTFTAKSDSMRALYILARDGRIGLDVVDDGGSPTAEAVRLRLKRTVKELRDYCPALAEELATFAIDRGAVRYERRVDSPRIDVGLALAGDGGTA
ncbi:MAG: hypothetical protein HYX43_10575, partial [Burkholderiales bacterium]|nr:hypothetical protein [Burkholderiales bacterium]